MQPCECGRIVQLFIPCEPIGKQPLEYRGHIKSPVTGRLRPRMVNPDATKDMMQLVQDAYAAQVRGPRPAFAKDVPLIATFTFYITRPKSVPRHKREFPITKPDLKNLTALVEDALNELAYHDDCQIVGYGEPMKLYADDHEPGIEVVIQEITTREAAGSPTGAYDGPGRPLGLGGVE